MCEGGLIGCVKSGSIGFIDETVLTRFIERAVR